MIPYLESCNMYTVQTGLLPVSKREQAAGQPAIWELPLAVYQWQFQCATGSASASGRLPVRVTGKAPTMTWTGLYSSVLTINA